MPTDLEIKNAKPQDKNYTINIGDGLSLLIKKQGSKLWRFRYSFLGKRCMVSLGKYPQISMKQAKAKQREYLDMLDNGINPSSHKQTQKIKLATEKVFKEVALEWYVKRYQERNQRHAKLVTQRMNKYLFPILGKVPIKQIEAPMLFNIWNLSKTKAT